MEQQTLKRAFRHTGLIIVLVATGLLSQAQLRLPDIDTIEYSVPVSATLPGGGEVLVWQRRINNLLTRIVVGDSIISVSVISGNKWDKQAKSAHNLTFREGIEISTVDLNNDGYTDLLVSDPVMRGNYLSTVFLFRPRQASFRHAPAFDLMNIRADTATGLIRSSCLGGLFDNRKELYLLKGSSPVFYKGVQEEITMDSTGSTIEYYFESRSGKRKIIHRRKGTPDDISQAFEEALWQGNEP